MLLLIPALTGQAFKVFPWILDTSQGANHMIMRWLRLYTHSKWLPHQNQTHMVFLMLHMMWMCVQIPQHSGVIMAIDPFKMASTSISNTYEVLQTPISMCCGCAYGHTLQVQLPLLGWPSVWKVHIILRLPIEGQTTVQCGSWGYRPIQDDFHINIKNMKGVAQPSYDVVVHMDMLHHITAAPGPRSRIFWKIQIILATSWGANYIIGCAYGQDLTKLLLPSLANLFEITYSFWLPLEGQITS